MSCLSQVLSVHSSPPAGARQCPMLSSCLAAQPSCIASGLSYLKPLHIPAQYVHRFPERYELHGCVHWEEYVQEYLGAHRGSGRAITCGVSFSTAASSLPWASAGRGAAAGGSARATSEGSEAPTTVCWGQVVRMGPGKVTTTGGGQMITRESPQATTQGSLLLAARG